VHMQDVAWHSKHEYMFGSVGDDKQLIVWDTRQPVPSSASLQSNIDVSMSHCPARTTLEFCLCT
jgi:hypothetical protein